MIQLYSNLKTLDLHGLDREYSKILIKEFIDDCYKMKEKKIVIIHGIGTGIIRKTTQEVLKNNKKVKLYKIDNFNPGMTIVELNIK